MSAEPKQEIATREEYQAPAAPQPNTAAAIIQVIERAATDASVDVDKMERLLAMQERIMDRQAAAAYASAMAEMQPKLPVIRKRGAIKNSAGKIQSTYAKWEDIDAAIRPILTEYGFALTFRTETREGRPVVWAVLAHREGHSERTEIELPIDTSGSKNNVQGVGSSMSYGKRYAASALLNLVAEDEDDDGQKAGAGALISDDQVMELRRLMTEAKANAGAFLEYLGVDALEDLPAPKFATAKAALLKKKQGAQ